MKKIFFSILCLFLALFVYSNKINASSNMVYVSGANLGIKLQTEVEVIGTFGVNNGEKISTPWLDKIEEHDIIIKANGNEINSANDLINIVETSNGNSLSLIINRNNKLIDLNVQPALNSNNKYSLGLYIKDYDMGVGTMSFVEKESLKYAALGHSMVDKSISGGSIYRASVKEIVLPRDNIAGNKKADIIGNEIGKVDQNLNNGVYGVLNDNNLLKNMTLMEISKREDVHKGDAYILTSIESTTIEAFDISITEVKKQVKSDIKGIRFKVTDETLLNKTGGIIQGMSGSPIIQDGKIVGAVTHVVLKDASLGYGCYAEFMYNQMGFSLR